MATSSASENGQNEEKIFTQFQQLRQEQQSITLKISEFESEINKHE